MTKVIYLKDADYNWQKFEYEGNLVDSLKEELTKRNISIGNRASIGNGASIGNRASIGKEVKLITGFYINGSRHTVTYVGEGKISIGCQTKTIEWFKDNYEALGESEGYSESEITEYKCYIDMAEMFHNLNYKK